MIKFSFLKIPVNIHPSFWIFLLIFTGVSLNFSFVSLIIAAVMFVSLLVHEYGHALTALYFGSPSVEINLEAFGGNARYNGRGFSDTQEFLVTLNGPLFQSFLIFVPYILLENSLINNPYIEFTLYVTMKLNILWCLFNLLPVYPLDGGRISQFLLKKLFGENKGEYVNRYLGMATAVVGSVSLFFLEYYFFAGILLIYGAPLFAKNTGYKESEPSISPFQLYNQGHDHLTKEEFQEAKVIFKELLKSKDSFYKTSAIESLAVILNKENNRKAAYKLLKENHEELKSGKALLCKLAFEEGNFPLIEKYSHDIYQMSPSYEVALLNSKAFASLKKPELAGGWLRTASQFPSISKEDLAKVLGEAVYDPIRHDEAFKRHAPEDLL